jgi:hypothetical protein
MQVSMAISGVPRTKCLLCVYVCECAHVCVCGHVYILFDPDIVLIQ